MIRNFIRGSFFILGNRLRGMRVGLQHSITAIGSVILQSSVNMLGSLAVAATTAASKVNMLFLSILDALGAAMATYGGQNLVPAFFLCYT